MMYFLDKLPPIDWPSHGQIIFKRFYLRYACDSTFVLNNLNINIEGAEKVLLLNFNNLKLNYFTV